MRSTHHRVFPEPLQHNGNPLEVAAPPQTGAHTRDGLLQPQLFGKMVADRGEARPHPFAVGIATHLFGGGLDGPDAALQRLRCEVSVQDDIVEHPAPECERVGTGKPPAPSECIRRNPGRETGWDTSPSGQPRELNDTNKYDAGQWTRVLIDATRSWEIDPRPEWGGRRFPPTDRLESELESKIAGRWEEYGIGIPYLDDDGREMLTL